MSAEVVAPEPEPTIVRNGRGLLLVLMAAEGRGLPMPFAIRADRVYDEITLQFFAWDEVVTWAEVLDYAEVDPGRGEARGVWLEVPVVVCTNDRQAAS